MKAISVRQPWAWAIAHAGKDIENRPRAWHYRGPVAIHASNTLWRDPELAREFIKSVSGLEVPADLARGRIVAVADLVDCLVPYSECDSPWYFKSYGLVLRNVRPLPVEVPCKGALGLWTVPDCVAVAVKSQL